MANTRIYRFLGWLIRREREKANLSQMDLGERIGLSAVDVAEIEQGERRPSREECLHLAAALLIDPNHVMEAADWPSVNLTLDDLLDRELDEFGTTVIYIGALAGETPATKTKAKRKIIMAYLRSDLGAC